MISAKPLRIIFDKVKEFIRDYHRTKYLVLLDLEENDAIYDRFRYIVGFKSSITYVFSYSSGKIKIDSDDDFPLEETFCLHNVMIFIESVFNTDQNQYYCDIFLEKCLNLKIS